MEEVKIRPIIAKDNPALGALIRKVLMEMGVPKNGTAYEDSNLDGLYEFYQAPRSAYFVVTVGKEVLGGAGIAPLLGGSPEVCELQKMYFDSRLRGRGIGSKMLKVCLAKAVEFNYEKCYLETMPYMTAAVSMYRKFGFKDLDGPMGNTGHSSCHVWMSCDLKNSLPGT